MKLRPVGLAVGSPLKEGLVDIAKTITTSFGLLVENGDEVHELTPEQLFEPEPSMNRVGELWTGVMSVRARRRLMRKKIRLPHKPKPTPSSLLGAENLRLLNSCT